MNRQTTLTHHHGKNLKKLCLTTAVPVSYTHLDVYKRQDGRFFNLAGPDRTDTAPGSSQREHANPVEKAPQLNVRHGPGCRVPSRQAPLPALSPQCPAVRQPQYRFSHPRPQRCRKMCIRDRLIQLQFVIRYDLPKLGNIKGSQSCTAGNQDAFGCLAAGELVFLILPHGEVLGAATFQPCLLYTSVFRFCLCFLVLVLFAPGLLGGAIRLLCLAGILRPARFIFLPHAVRGTAFPAVLLKLTAFGLQTIMARRAVLSGILVLKPQTPGWCGGRSFPFSRSGAIAPGILRRPRPLKIPFVRFLSNISHFTPSVSEYSKKFVNTYSGVFASMIARHC